ncbi:DUF5707 domain-containing protein [Streptomyces sp. NPDC098781]|uniref:DUF5707 domain-containing protein n=1 Tax=Streptomyces sp. NPDC098781 TaxID=3366097 RepID=UPI00380AB271
MRVRATVAALCGALACTALVAPAAQATGVTANTADTKITHVSVNNGNNVVVNRIQKKSFPVTVTVKDPSGVQKMWVELWHGTDRAHADGRLAGVAPGTCERVDAATSTCDFTVVADTRTNLRKNYLAGTWKVRAVAVMGDGDDFRQDVIGTARVQRATQLWIDASPEPVRKGRPLEATGQLTIANWETGTNVGYVGQSVNLQYRKASSGPFTNLKAAKSGSKGWLKTSATAKDDGFYRFVFLGTSSTSAAGSSLDFVDAK